MGTKIGILRNITVDQQADAAGSLTPGEIDGVMNLLKYIREDIQEFNNDFQTEIDEFEALVQKEFDDTQTKQDNQLTETQSFHTDANAKLDTINGSVKTASTQIQQLLTDKFSETNTNIDAFQQSMETELGKLQNGQTVAAAQLTELETLITQSNTLLSQILQALNASVTSINDRLTALEARTNFPLQEETETTLSLTPNVYHQWGEVESLNLTFQEGTDPDIVDEYVFQFTSPAQTPTVLTLPDTVKWIGDSEILSGLTYVVTVVNNLAVLGGA